MRKSSIGGAPLRVRPDNTSQPRNPSRERTSYMGMGRPSTSGHNYGSSSSSGYGSSKGLSFGSQRMSSAAQFSSIPKMGRPSSGIGVRGRTDVIKDTRPIYDKKYQTQCIKQLLEFLVNYQYPHPISHKLLELPSGKDFFKIFEFIVSQFWFGYKQVPKMEEEVPRLLKLLGYPFTISKTQLMSAGSPHTWPHLLASLIWIIESLPLSTINVEANGGIDAFIFGSMDSDNESDAVSMDKILFDDCIRTYNAFMAGEDTFEKQNEMLAKTLMHKFQGCNVDDMQDENARLETELNLMEQAEKKKRKLQEAIESCKCDCKLLSAHVSDVKNHRKAIEAEKNSSEEELLGLSSNLQAEREKLVQLQQVYEKQEFSQADVDRMRAEQDSLRQEVEKLEKEIATVDSDMWDISMKQAKINEECEKEATSYNRIAMSLKLVPETTELANGRDFKLYTGFNSDPVGAFETTVKPMLTALKKSLTDDIRKKDKTLFQLAGENEQFTEAINERKAKLEKMEKEYNGIDEEIESLKKALATDKASFAHEIEVRQQCIKQHDETIKQLKEEKDALNEEYRKCVDQNNMERAKIKEDSAKRKREYAKLCEDVDRYKMNIDQVLDDFTLNLETEMVQKFARLRQFQADVTEIDVYLDSLNSM